jgi:peptidoglycan/xylan/chitin deacetylase (PgdA/CDA1 family)
MFHHFYDDMHPKGQGAISATDLNEMIQFIGRKNILTPTEWMRSALDGTLPERATCFTFDDALKCQVDVALPVLADHGIEAVFFIYSSVFQGQVETLEVYRLFRTVNFENIDDFYTEFSRQVRKEYAQEHKAGLKDFDPKTYLADCAFYSDNDRIFRYLRDDVLGPIRFQFVMNRMIAASDFRVSDIRHLLWMTDEDLRNMHRMGHTIGLHSFSHPTRLAEMSPAQQRNEYTRNWKHIGSVINEAPTTVAHPCGSYTAQTLQILEDLGVKVGFRASAQTLEKQGPLEYPRYDHADIMRELRVQ